MHYDESNYTNFRVAATDLHVSGGGEMGRFVSVVIQSDLLHVFDVMVSLEEFKGEIVYESDGRSYMYFAVKSHFINTKWHHICNGFTRESLY